MDLEAFLRELADVEVRRVVPFTPGAPLPSDGVLVGRSVAGPVPPGLLVLDNKASRTPSVARLTAELPEAALAAWPPWQHRPGPKAALAALTIVAEDASPDSLWGVLLLLARLAGCGLGDTLPAWLDSIERWEREGMVDDPWTAWPSLASALAHAQYTAEAAASAPDYAAAWTKGLRFAAECLLRGQGPDGLHPGPGWPLLEEAAAALQQEQDTFHNWLPHAHVVQLSLPLATGNRRRILVDALLFTEDQPTGAAKVLYRMDKDAPLGRGYTLAAHHRPGAPPGSGNEFTIALDPRHGLHLQDLWDELERREDAAWQAAGVARPDWAPRRGMDTRFNEPWFLDRARTLIAAPHRVRDERVAPAMDLPGTRLGWADVQDAVWTVYNPLHGILVTTPLDPAAPGPLLQAPAKQATAGGKRLVLARWHSGGARALGTAPVIERTLAALVGHAAGKPVGLADLPPPSAWRRVELSGGFAVASQAGLFVLDDWRPAALDLAAIEHAFSAAVRLDEALSRIEAEQAGPLAGRLRAALGRGRAMSEPRGLVVDAARAAVSLADLRADAAGLPANADARAVREALDGLWGLDRRLAALEQQVRTIRESVTALGDARVRRMTQAIALVGFPYYVGNGLAAPLARLVAADWAAPVVAGAAPVVAGAAPVGADPPPWLWWACFMAVTLGVAALLLAWQASGGRRVQRPGELEGDG